ncbi:hypothetical protein EV192_1091, partial [Actinocrispum wychmicini]
MSDLADANTKGDLDMRDSAGAAELSTVERDVVLGFGGGVVGDGLGLGVVHGLFEGWVD